MQNKLTIGWILVNDEKDTICSKTLDTLRKTCLANGIVEFHSGKEITAKFPMLDGPMEAVVGYFNPASVCHILTVTNNRDGRMQPKPPTEWLRRPNVSGRDFIPEQRVK